MAELVAFRATAAQGPACAEEIERAKTDGRSWQHIDRSRPPRDTVLVWRNGLGDCELALNMRPDGFSEWAFLR